MFSAKNREPFMAALAALNPNPKSELNYSTPFELLVAVMLSAQATDKGVNLATAKLFPVANTPQKILDLGLDGLIPYVQTINLYRTKAQHLIEACRILIDRFHGEVPRTRDELVSLPGVGRKTANVVMNVAFGEPAIAVDTHIFRVLRINRRGTSLSAYTEKTGVVPFVKLIALCGMYELESGRDISVPYDSPAFLDDLARSYGRTAYRYLSAPSDGSDNVARRLAARQFWSRDALFTAAKLACILEEKNMTFPELYSLLPPLFVYSTTAQLELPPDYLDEFEGENFSFGRDGANGFVLVEKRGKTHISPLGNGRFRLTAQSFDEETARELCAEAQAFISSGAK